MADPPPQRRDPTRWYDLAKPISKEHAAAIGYVVVNWSLAQEWQTQILILLLGTAGEAGHAVTAELAELQKVSVGRAILIHARRQEWLDEWDEITRGMNDLRNLRNDIVHGFWGVNTEGIHFYERVRASGHVTKRAPDFSADDLSKLSDKIVDLADRFIQFHAELQSNGGYGVATIASEAQPLVPGQGREARIQAQGRVQKQARKDAQRTASRKPNRDPNAS